MENPEISQREEEAGRWPEAVPRPHYSAAAVGLYLLQHEAWMG